MNAGDWVVRTSLDRVAKVKEAYEDVLDLVFYNRDGSRLGRESPPMGGPRSFEPACSVELWVPINEPTFPLNRWGPIEGLKFKDR